MTATPRHTEGFHPAVTLIRALRQPENGEDEPAWVARWATLLEEATIEDAEAAIADVLLQLAHINDTLMLHRKYPRRRWIVPGTQMVAFRAVRQAQLRYLREWLAAQRADEKRAMDAETKRVRIRANAEQAKTVAEARAHMRAVHAREQAIARERVAFIRDYVPDGSSDVVMLIQAARHVIGTLQAKLGSPLDEHELAVLHALRSWLWADAGLTALDEVPLP